MRLNNQREYQRFYKLLQTEDDNQKRLNQDNSKRNRGGDDAQT